MSLDETPEVEMTGCPYGRPTRSAGGGELPPVSGSGTRLYTTPGIAGYRMTDFRDGYSQFEFAVILPFLDTRSNFLTRM